MKYNIRTMQENEYDELKSFLYEAIFIPEGVEPPPADIIERPELRVYTDDFGKMPFDTAVCAETDGKIVGAAWARIMDDYGHIDDKTPSVAISLYREYRGHGIGTQLMIRLLSELREKGCKKVSLAVQKANYAVRMYKKTGFVTVDENDEEYIMLCSL